MASHVDYRCLSKELYLSKILTLSVTERDLLTYCILLADDRGITPAYTALKLTSARETDLRQLVKKNYLHILRSEDFLCFILDWEIHQKNLRADRMKESDYIELLKKDFPFMKLKQIKERADLKNDTTNLDVHWTSSGHPKSNNNKNKDNTNSKVTTTYQVIYNNSNSNKDLNKNKVEIVDAAFSLLKISQKKAKEILKTYSLDRILDALSDLENRGKIKPLKNPAGLFIDMLEKDYPLLESTKKHIGKLKKEKKIEFCSQCSYPDKSEKWLCQRDGTRYNSATGEWQDCEFCEVGNG